MLHAFEVRDGEFCVRVSQCRQLLCFVSCVLLPFTTNNRTSEQRNQLLEHLNDVDNDG